MEQVTLLRFYDSNKSIGFKYAQMDSDTVIAVLGTMRMAEKKLLEYLDKLGRDIP